MTSGYCAFLFHEQVLILSALIFISFAPFKIFYLHTFKHPPVLKKVISLH